MQKTTLYSFSEQRLKQYGYHVLEKRAIPDYRDGLKPVQRHILWSMYKLGMHNDKPYHKAARVVGETISKYHPHGDACCRKGTLIPLVNGKVKRIEDLVNTGKKKYRVWAYNEKTEKVVTAEAYNFREGQTTDIMYRITINEEFTIECTGNHPFMLRCGVWKRADELKVGNYLLGGKQITNKYLWINSSRNNKKNHARGIAIEKEVASLKPEQYEQNHIIQFRFKRFRRIYPVFGADNFNLICLITNVECVQLNKPEVFYDFSVEEYQNMFVIPNNHKGNVRNYVLLHNSVYQSMVNMAGAINPDAQSSKDIWNNTNTNVPLIEGMGNWGTLLDAAASYRYCLPSDTKIYTDKGIVTFEDLIDINENLKIGEPIYLKEELKTPSLNSKYEPITYCVYSGEHELVEVRTENAPSIRCTKNHPFLTVTKTGFEWVEAQYLTLDHTVCVTSNVCNVTESSITSDEALLLGLIVGDGWVTKYTIGFSNTSRSVNNIYRRIATAYLREPKERVIKNIGKKPYRSLEINSKELVEYITDYYDISAGNSRMRYVPKKIFTASNFAVCSFLSGIFDCEGSISKDKISFSSSSLRLCEDIQNLLLCYLGVIATIVKDRTTYILYITHCENLEKFLSNVFFLTKSKIKKSQILLKKIKNISNKAGNARHGVIPFIDLNSSGYEVHKTRSKFFKNFKNYSVELQEKYKHHYVGGYIYSKVKSVKELNKKSKVYDLHIKTTNAFTANGYIVHNTECKLSKYADKYLLDSDYINAVPFIKNFDGKETLPLYLPSKVPNLLINGSAAIAFGVSIDCPSFSFQSVLKTTKLIIEGENDINVCKNLRLKPKVGGKCVSKFDDYFSLFESGEAKVIFEPEFVINDNIITFTSLCPSLSSETSLMMFMDKLSSLSFVKSVYNTSSKSFSYEVELADASKENIEKIISLSRRSQKYDFGMTITKLDNIQFKKVGIFDYLKSWCNWRTRIESLVLRQLIEVEENKIFKLKTILFAHKNFDKIVKCLNSDDAKTNLIKILKINSDQATEILNMRLSTLSKVSISKIQNLMSECNRQVEYLKGINPVNRIISDWK